MHNLQFASGFVSAPVSAQVVLLDAAPIVTAGGPYQVMGGGSVQLSALATPVFSGDTIIAYKWVLDGDGLFGEIGPGATRGTETGSSPTFSAAGISGGAGVTRTVSLRAQNSDGSVGTAIATISIFDPVPTANPSGPYFTIEEGLVQLHGSGTVPQPGDPIIAYRWDLDGDQIFGESGANAICGDEIGQNPTFYAHGRPGFAGGYSVIQLIAQTRSGNFSPAAFGQVYVADAAPTVSAGGPYSVIEGKTVSLTASASTVYSGDQIVSYVWDLDGDGVFGETGASAGRGAEVGQSVVFSAVGLTGSATATFNAAVRATNNDGSSTNLPAFYRSVDTPCRNYSAPEEDSKLPLRHVRGHHSSISSRTSFRSARSRWVCACRSGGSTTPSRSWFAFAS